MASRDMAAEGLIDRVEAELERLVRAHEGAELPRLSRLARRFGVSVPTVRKAARRLVARGLLETGRGRRMRRRGSNVPSGGVSSGELSSAERLYRHLRSRIEEGVYRTGRELPKQAHFAIGHHVSLRTVRQCYRRLRDEGLIRRRGRSYVAGRESPAALKGSRWNRPVVFVCSSPHHGWLAQHQSERTHRFVTTFMEQMEQARINVVEASYDRGLGQFTVRDYARQPTALDDSIRACEGRFRGVLLACSTFDVPSLFTHMHALLRHGLPVVWFDRLDESCPSRPSHERLLRCHFAEEGAVAEAVNTLTDLGHRRLGYVAPFIEDWAQARGEKIARYAQSHPRAPEVIRHAPVRRLIRDTRAGELLRQVKRFCDTHPAIGSVCREVVTGVPRHMPALGGGAVGRRSGDLRDLPRIITYLDEQAKLKMLPYALHEKVRLAIMTPYLVPFVAHHPPTAMIVCRDSYASRVCQWLTLAGLDIPSRISIISFDNEFVRHPWGLASVDFGFGHLGYTAAHFIIGDIPVRRDRYGNCAALSHVSQWSTLGRAAVAEAV
jgi:DNA-binding LacI/PurR family transcriptional regulator/DNA-binding transcriptional regulator YhcF (GntR family)